MRKAPWINVLIYLSFTLLTSCLGLVSALLLTHLLLPEEYGRVGIFLSALYIVSPLVSVSAEGLIAVNKTTLSAPDYERFQRTTVCISLLACVLAELLLLAAYAAGMLPDPLLLASPPFALIRFWATMAGTEYVAEQHAVLFGVLGLMTGLAALALTYLLITFVHASAPLRIAALFGADLLLLFVRYHGRFTVLLKPLLDPQFKAQVLAFGLPSMIALLGAWGLNESDKVVVAHHAGLATAGLYTAAATLAAVMVSFNQALTNAMFPSLYQKLKQDAAQAPRFTWQYMLKFLSMAAAFAALLLLGYFWLGPRLLPARYADGARYFVALVISSLAITAYRPIGLVVDYFKLARIRALAVSCGGAASIGVAWFGMRAHGDAVWAAAGIGTGYLLAGALLFGAVLWFAPKTRENAACDS